MAPTPTLAASHTGKVYLVSSKYVPRPKPGQVHFKWKYDSKSVDAFSVWFYNVKTHKYTVVVPSYTTRVQGNGGGDGLITIDRLVGVAGVYEIKLAAQASGYDATSPTKVYATSGQFVVKIDDFET
ncbi:hypothetical protein FRB90_005399 [Tulasnella sp. 427]|nr:hypothetical protein FRB90_005399 [Tulasnella sp. 427]